MKSLILFGLIFFPVIGFSQVVDSAAVEREVDSLVLVCRTLTGQQKFNEALQLIEDAKGKAEAELGKMSAAYASCVHTQGKIYIIMGKYSDAEPFCIEAMDIRATMLGKEHPDYSSSLNNLATLYREMGQYDKAEPLALEAKEIRAKTPGKESPEYAATLNLLAILYYNLGQYEQSEAFYLETKDILAKAPGKEYPEYAQTLDNLAVLYSDIGLYDKAEGLYLEARDIRAKAPGKESIDYAVSLNNLATFNYETGQYIRAEQFFLEAKGILAIVVGKDHQYYGAALNNLAALYNEMGQYSEAELLFLEAKDIRAKTLGKEHPFYAASLNNLATFYYDIGQYAKAEPLYLEANRILAKALGEDHPDYASPLENLAALYYEIGQYAKAEPLFLEAKNIRLKALGNQHPDYASTLNNLALFYSNSGQYAKAEPLFLEAKDIWANTPGKEHQEYAAPLHNLANLYKEMGMYAKAEPLYLEAINIYAKTLGKVHSYYAKVLTDLAVFYWQTKQSIRAAPLMMEIASIQHTLLLKGARHLSELELSEYEKTFVKTIDHYFSFAQGVGSASGEMPALCFDNRLFYNGFLLTAVNQMKRLALSDPTTAKKYIALTGFHRSLASEYAKPITERDSTGIADIEDKANTLEKELIRTVAGYGEVMSQVTWQGVQQHLKPGEIAIEFAHYHYYNPEPTDSIFYSALVLRPGDKAPQFVPLFEEREIAPLLENAKGGNVRGINALYSPGGQVSLYALIWKPLEEPLKGVETVYCSPSGLLHRLNLGAIPSDGGQTFSDRRQLVLLGSTRQLVVPNITKVAGNSAYVVGGVRYEMDSTAIDTVNTSFITRGMTAPDELPFNVDSTSRGDTWKYLPGSATEATEISNVLKSANFDVQLDTGYSATEEKFKRLGSGQPSPRTILVSTHGFFFPDPESEAVNEKVGSETTRPVFKTSDHPMMRSGLILAGANHAWTKGKSLQNGEDGILTAYEISQMNLAATELVVLSACETGLGYIEGNEGVYGLQRAFKIAGAKYLVMSLWKVNDQSTSEFMTEFYRQWLEKGLAIPEAFRTAQQAMEVKYKDPYHWAGFVLVE